MTEKVCSNLGCKGKTSLVCDKCKYAAYCSPECLTEHWPNHNSQCYLDRLILYPTLLAVPHYERYEGTRVLFWKEGRYVERSFKLPFPPNVTSSMFALPSTPYVFFGNLEGKTWLYNLGSDLWHSLGQTGGDSGFELLTLGQEDRFHVLCCRKQYGVAVVYEVDLETKRLRKVHEEKEIGVRPCLISPGRALIGFNQVGSSVTLTFLRFSEGKYVTETETVPEIPFRVDLCRVVRGGIQLCVLEGEHLWWDTLSKEKVTVPTGTTMVGPNIRLVDGWEGTTELENRKESSPNEWERIKTLAGSELQVSSYENDLLVLCEYPNKFQLLLATGLTYSLRLRFQVGGVSGFRLLPAEKEQIEHRKRQLGEYLNLPGDLLSEVLKFCMVS